MRRFSAAFALKGFTLSNISRSCGAVGVEPSESSTDEKPPTKLDPARVTAVVHNFLLKEENSRGAKASKVILDTVESNFAELPVLLLARVAVADWPADAWNAALYKRIRRHVYESIGELSGTQVAQLIIVWGSRPSHAKDLGVFQKLGLALEYHINNVKDVELIFGVLRTMIDVKLRPPQSFVELMARRFSSFDRHSPFTCAQCIDAMLLLHQLDGLSAITAKILIGRVVTHMDEARQTVTARRFEAGDTSPMTRDEARQALKSIGLTGVRVHKLLKLVVSFRIAKQRMVSEFFVFLEPFIDSMSHVYLVDQILPTVRILGAKVPQRFLEKFLNKIGQSSALDLSTTVSCMNLAVKYLTSPNIHSVGEGEEGGEAPIQKSLQADAFVTRALELTQATEAKGNVLQVVHLLGCIHRLIEYEISCAREAEATALVAKVRPCLPTVVRTALTMLERGLLPLMPTSSAAEVFESYSPDGEAAELVAKFKQLAQKFCETPESRSEYRKLVPLPKTFHLIMTVNKRVHFDLAPSEKHAQMLADLHTTLCSRHPVGILQLLKVFEEHFPGTLQPAIRRVFTASLLARLRPRNVPEAVSDMARLDPEKLVAIKAEAKELRSIAKDAQRPDEERDAAWKKLKQYEHDRRHALNLVRIHSSSHLTELVALLNDAAPLAVKTNPAVWEFVARFAKLHNLPELQETAASRAEQFRAVQNATAAITK